MAIVARRYLCLDPASRVVGWASLDSRAGEILNAGKVSETKGTYVERCDKLAVKIRRLAQTEGTDGVVIEVPSGKVHMSHGGRGEGLSIYGFAVATIRAALKELWDVAEIPVAEWKSGYSKEKAIKVATKHYPRYRSLKDSGADIADAIALGVWFYAFRLRGR